MKTENKPDVTDRLNCPTAVRSSDLFGIMCRIIIMPFVLLMALAGCIAHVMVWTFDPSYNHRAALDAMYGFMGIRSNDKVSDPAL